MAGVRYTDRDDDGMVVEHLHYACGCQNYREEFHDGSVHPGGRTTTARCWWTRSSGVSDG